LIRTDKRDPAGACNEEASLPSEEINRQDEQSLHLKGNGMLRKKRLEFFRALLLNIKQIE
jgi:hypothetical protein